MDEKSYDPYTGYEIQGESQEQHNENQNPQQDEQPEQSHGLTVAAMVVGIISVVLMLTCCCSPFAIFTGIAAIVLFAVAPKKNGKKESKAVAGLICGIVSIIGTCILILIFIFNIVLSDEFQTLLDENLQGIDRQEYQYDEYDEDFDEIF